ncbi:hypothetical protein B0H10DRAFT_2103786 [Mycena sp. CBHHK59/15]|nr:hypothetical protein B0H10DRAFT_2103786 [Mycena sp. CBHHK59/15]
MRLSTSSLVACVALVLSFSTSAAAKPSPTTPRARREFLSLNPRAPGAVIRGSAAARAPPRPGRTQSALRAACLPRHRTILVSDSSGPLGYLTSQLNDFVSYSLDAPSQLDVTVLNPAPLNYNYLGYVSHSTSNGRPPVSGANTFSDSTQDDEDIESSIWSYDPVTGALAPQWLNSDSSAPPTSIMYVVEEPSSPLRGPETFVNTFGIGEVVTFTLVL